MRRNWLHIINRILDDKSLKPEHYSDYRNAKQYLEFKITVTRLIKDFFFIIAGIFSASFGFKGFLLTNHFIDGGATGISLLLSSITGYPLYILIICVNIPFILMAYKVMGRNFAIKTTLAICGLALCVATVNFPNVTNDNLLVAIFGGFFLGAGIGLAVRGGAVIDGTEVLAIFVSKKFGITIGDVIILINILIFSAAAKFLGINVALYSMITYLSASKTLDFIVEGIEEYIGVTIITGRRGFGKHGETKDIDIIYSVITRLEVHKMNTEIQKIDPNSFVVMTSVKDTKGGMIKKRPLKH
jgi:uncharacterized membrane-anchored protein YitT (DUF2179 family)